MKRYTRHPFPPQADHGSVFTEYLIALVFLILVFAGVAAWMDFAVNERVDNAVNSVSEMAPCRPGGPLERWNACY